VEKRFTSSSAMADSEKNVADISAAQAEHDLMAQQVHDALAKLGISDRAMFMVLGIDCAGGRVRKDVTTAVTQPKWSATWTLLSSTELELRITNLSGLKAIVYREITGNKTPSTGSRTVDNGLTNISIYTKSAGWSATLTKVLLKVNDPLTGFQFEAIKT
jgi:hypothetical protein